MQPRKRRKKPQRPKPRAHPLIPPFLTDLANRLESGVVHTDNTAGRHLAAWSDTVVPRELVPFLESLDVRVLVDAVRRHPWLYCHPLVVHELFCLAHLRGNLKAWEDVGWKWENQDRRPREADEAEKRLRELLEAHAQGLFPRQRIKWTRPRRKSGPKARMKNPFPATPDDEFIDSERLYVDWYDLKQEIQHHWPFPRSDRESSRKRYTQQLSSSEYMQLAQKALQRSGPSWSSRHPPSFPEGLDEQGRPTFEPWDVKLDPVIDPVIKWLCDEDKLRPKRKHGEGRPARLAYALLGALFAEDPSQAWKMAKKVKNRIETHLAKRRRHRKAPR